jgi:hypothetical protein
MVSLKGRIKRKPWVSLKGRIKRKPWVSFKEGSKGNYVPFISGSLILITFLVGLHETGLSLN